MTKKLSLVMTLALTLVINTAFALDARFDMHRAFIKVKMGHELPTSKYIQEHKALFGGNYLVKTTDVLKLEKDLLNNPSVIRIERNYFAGKKDLPKLSKIKSNTPSYRFAAFNDPKVGKLWAFLDDNRNGVSVNRSYLAPLNTVKEDIIVAVVDTGVDYKHEDLQSVMWKNVNEIEGNGIDDDNNGYIDDIFGIDPLDNDTDPMASHSHGTHVSGTIAAKQNNKIGIAGIASNAKIMAIRAVPDNSDETDADVVESFLYAARHGARLINCSFGKAHNEGGMIVNETIDHIGLTFGTLVLAAAGNDYKRNIDKKKTYPASFETDHMIVVASTNRAGKLSSFSNVGLKSVDVAAPGSTIYSTVPGNSYGNMSGTSMATPTTAGVAADILSNFPALDSISIKEILIDSVTKVNKFDKYMVSGGRVDLFNALRHTLNNYIEIEQRQLDRQTAQQRQRTQNN
jgi:subtilisin family serine protease